MLLQVFFSLQAPWALRALSGAKYPVVEPEPPPPLGTIRDGRQLVALRPIGPDLVDGVWQRLDGGLYDAIRTYCTATPRQRAAARRHWDAIQRHAWALRQAAACEDWATARRHVRWFRTHVDADVYISLDRSVLKHGLCTHRYGDTLVYSTPIGRVEQGYDGTVMYIDARTDWQRR